MNWIAAFRGITNKRQLRALAVLDPQAFWKSIHGAGARGLAACHRWLHLDQVQSDSAEELAAL